MRVSIVITNYNYGRFLRRSIDSALQQIHLDKEVIVVDDASSDGSHVIIESYGEAIRPIIKPANAGQAAAFNTGLQASNGDIVQFLDADDYLYPDASTQIVDAWTRDCAQLQYRLHIVDDEGSIIGSQPAPEDEFDDGDVVSLLAIRGRYLTTVTSGLAFSRQSLMKVFPIPEEPFRVGADGYLTTVIPFTGKVASINDYLGAYCVHSSNLSAFSSGILDQGIAQRTRWRVAHDHERIAALVRVASLEGVHIGADPLANDPFHTESLLVLMLLDREQSLWPRHGRWRLALRGIRTAGTMRTSAKQRLLYRCWFFAVGLAPEIWARKVVRWKHSADSRPTIVRKLVDVMYTRARRRKFVS